MSNTIIPLPLLLIHHSYTLAIDRALHGFSATFSAQEVEILNKSVVRFVSAYNDHHNIITLDTTYTPEFLSLNPSVGLWPASHYGEGVIIGVVDSGIWPESLSFKDYGMTADIPIKWKGSCEEAGEDFNSSLCNYKLIGASYFNDGLKMQRLGNWES